MSELTRRDVLVASAAIPAAAALHGAPLTLDELRVLAMTATPPDAWRGRENEYTEQGRILSPGTQPHRILGDLESRGLVAFTDTPWRGDMDFFATPTPEGYAELARNGIDVRRP